MLDPQTSTFLKSKNRLYTFVFDYSGLILVRKLFIGFIVNSSIGVLADPLWTWLASYFWGPCTTIFVVCRDFAERRSWRSLAILLQNLRISNWNDGVVSSVFEWIVAEPEQSISIDQIAFFADFRLFLVQIGINDFHRASADQKYFLNFKFKLNSQFICLLQFSFRCDDIIWTEIIRLEVWN